MTLARTARVTDSRMERAVRIYEAGLVRVIGAGTFVVKSESSNVQIHTAAPAPIR